MKLTGKQQNYIDGLNPNDDGKNGKEFETRVHAFLNCRRTITSNNGRGNDGYFIDKETRTRIYYEVKSGAGELGTVDESGERFYKVLKSDFVIYSFDATLANAIVIDALCFVELAEQNKLLRTKANRNNGDRLVTIKSKTTVKGKTYDYPKKLQELLTAEPFTMTLAEFKELYKG